MGPGDITRAFHARTRRDATLGPRAWFRLNRGTTKTMTFTVSWWLLALVAGGTAPFWIRAIVNRWERRAEARSARVIGQFERESQDEEHGEVHEPPP